MLNLVCPFACIVRIRNFVLIFKNFENIRSHGQPEPDLFIRNITSHHKNFKTGSEKRYIFVFIESTFALYNLTEIYEFREKITE